MHLQSLFYIDNLSLIMIALISFVGLSIAAFSWRYLMGDRKWRRFFTLFPSLLLSTIVMVSADNVALFAGAWLISNVLLAFLMQHKREWSAARESSKLALQNFAVGALFLLFGLGVFYFHTHETSIRTIIHTMSSDIYTTVGLFCLLITAMTQSAIWPFHKWLTSSLNSPTPVSALMHAGLVNGGGFLLIRFSPLFLNNPLFLNAIFIVGICTAMMGTLWKLMQSDVKRMLACSTMGQMGFMIAQCGLGLFPAALAHLLFHGLFKAFLFLASGSAAQEKRMVNNPTVSSFLAGLVCGIAGAFAFSYTSQIDMFSFNTTFFLIALTCVTCTQFALSILQRRALSNILVAFVGTMLIGGFYGYIIFSVESLLASTYLEVTQPLNSLHIVALLTLIAAWLSVTFRKSFLGKGSLWPRVYVWALNASQPHAQTITAHRNQYQF